MARAGLTRVDIKRARDSLIAQGMHASIDAIRIALGNTGSKTTIHRYLKELEEEEGASLTRAASLSDAIQDLVAASRPAYTRKRRCASISRRPPQPPSASRPRRDR